MSRYKTEKKSLTSLTSQYTHSPEDIVASINDYVEAKFSDGWELVTMDTWLPDGSTHLFVFKANGQP